MREKGREGEREERRKRKRERREEDLPSTDSFIQSLNAHNNQTTRAGADQCQEPGSLFQSPTWLTGAQASATFWSALAENWMESEGRT